MAVVRCVMDLFQRPIDRLTQYERRNLVEDSYQDSHLVVWLFSQVHYTSDNSHRTADICATGIRVIDSLRPDLC
jgi:hypothetical protein